MNRFERGRSLKSVTTLGIGGSAEYFIEVHDIATMQSVLLFCKEQQLPYVILGKGSNSLFDDLGFAGVVIANRIHFLENSEAPIWRAGAGFSFSLLGSQSARKGWGGLEFASGIPGSVGGAVYMNAGANGFETSNTLLSVDFVTLEGELVTLKREELSFSYRFSSFQHMQGAIVAASFLLSESPTARKKQIEIIDYRKNTQPCDAKSAGCIFRNPSCGSAGAIIEQCGLKGKMIGGAQVSTIHANFVVNAGGAKATDVLELIAHIQNEVKRQTGIDLEYEVCYFPYYA